MIFGASLICRVVEVYGEISKRTPILKTGITMREKLVKGEKSPSSTVVTVTII